MHIESAIMIRGAARQALAAWRGKVLGSEGSILIGNGGGTLFTNTVKSNSDAKVV
jgi:hypothetical protein